MARLNEQEPEALAEYAHNVGYEASYATPDDDEPDYTRADLERLGLEALAASALFAVHADDPDARTVWARNYMRGWRFGESDGREYEQPTIETGDLESEAQP